jgi:hypothetical protein
VRCVTCYVDGTEEVSIKVEEVTDIKDEIPEATTSRLNMSMINTICCIYSKLPLDDE